MFKPDRNYDGTIDWGMTTCKYMLILLGVVVVLGLPFMIYEINKQENEPVRNELISEQDGCKLYLVHPRDVYWSTCEGSTQWQESSGKTSVTRHVITKRINE